MNLSLTVAELQKMTAGSQSRLRTFWRWWLGELHAALPPWLQAYLRSADRTLRVSLQGNRVVVAMRGGEGSEQLAAFALNDPSPGDIASAREALQVSAPAIHSCQVELPPEHLLRRVVSLPIDTEERLDDVLRFEMNRFTPFESERVCFAYRVVERDTANGTLRLQLLIVLRSLVDRLVEVFGACGLEISAIHAARSAAEPPDSALDLLPRELRPGNPLRRKLLPISLTGIAGVLALVAIALPVVSQQTTLEALQQQIDEVKPAALAAAQTKDKIAAMSRQQGLFAIERRASPTVISVMNEVTGVVPDNTWLVRFELHGRTVRIQGESASASSLIALLEASELIRDAKFSSPVTKNPRTSMDRFVIEAQVTAPEGSEQ